MKRRRTGRRGGETGRARRWWPLMLCAFFAGLLTVGLAILMPGGEIRNGRPSPAKESPASPSVTDGRSQVTGSSRDSLPVEVPSPLLAIVVDDCGYDPTRDAEWLKFPVKITMAVIPFGPSSRRLPQAAHDRGFGVLIHAPMEPEGPVSDRTVAFRFHRGMSGKEMDALLGRMIEENSWATGVSNYMGSAFTADQASMAAFAALLKERGLFFLDSGTSGRSVAVQAARQAGIPVARRDVFLDAGDRPEEMRLQWEKAISIAKRKGTAVLVSHGKRESLRMLLDLLPDLERQGIRTVTLDELLEKDRTS